MYGPVSKLNYYCVHLFITLPYHTIPYPNIHYKSARALEVVVKLRANFWKKSLQPPHCTKTDQSVLYRLLLVVGDTGKLLRAACVAF